MTVILIYYFDFFSQFCIFFLRLLFYRRVDLIVSFSLNPHFLAFFEFFSFDYVTKHSKLVVHSHARNDFLNVAGTHLLQNLERLDYFRVLFISCRLNWPNVDRSSIVFLFLSIFFLDSNFIV